MNCASLETMLADLVWIEEESVQPINWLPIICALACTALLLAIVALTIRHRLRQPCQRLKRILQNPPTAAQLDEIHSLVVDLRKQFPQLETIIPELDRLRFAPQSPSDEQLKDLYQTIRDICG